MTYVTDEQFNLADNATDERTVDALNTSFNSISQMCDEYVNYSTPQDWVIFQYSGIIAVGTPIKVSYPTDGTINIWGMSSSSGNTSYSFLGTLSGNVFTPSMSGYVTICQPYRKAL